MTEWKETEIIPRIPSTWTEFKLEKIGHFKNGVNFSDIRLSMLNNCIKEDFLQLKDLMKLYPKL